LAVAIEGEGQKFGLDAAPRIDDLDSALGIRARQFDVNRPAMRRELD
jgi:hypothetical protein